jgi:hypothetical protein
MGETEILFRVLIVALDTSVWRLREADSPRMPQRIYFFSVLRRR